MKNKLNFFALTLSLLFAFGWAQAQDQGRAAANPEESAKRLTERMVETLELSEEQAAELQELNLKHAREAHAERQAMRDNREEARQKMRATMEKRQEELKNTLGEEKYNQWVEARNAALKERRGERPPRGPHRNAPRGKGPRGGGGR
jgi:sugar-specific transcriptional regulator TrmB